MADTQRAGRGGERLPGTEARLTSDPDRAVRLRLLDAELAERVLGYRGRITAYRPGDHGHEDPITVFLEAPEGAEGPLRPREGLVTAEGAPIPRCYVPKRYSASGDAMYELQSLLLGRGWLSGHQDVVADGERRTVAHYSHRGIHSFVDAEAPDHLEAHALAVLRTVPEVARAAGTGAFAVLVSRPLLEEADPDALNDAIAQDLGAPYEEDLVGPAVDALHGTGAGYVLLVWNFGVLRRVAPIEPPAPDVPAETFLRSVATDARETGLSMPTLLNLLVLTLPGEIAAVPFTETADGAWQLGIGRGAWFADPDLPVVKRCRYCGCTDNRACPGSCYWQEQEPVLAVGVCSNPDCLLALGRARAVATEQSGEVAPA